MKTLNLLHKYLRLLEQDGLTLDPTETGTAAAPDTAAPEQTPEVEPLTSIAEQSYISTCVRAFAFKPTDEQINSINDALLKYGNTRPRVVRDMIEGYLPARGNSIDSLLSNTK